MIAGVIIGVLVVIATIGSIMSEAYDAGYRQGRIDEHREVMEYINGKKKD